MAGAAEMEGAGAEPPRSPGTRPSRGCRAREGGLGRGGRPRGVSSPLLSSDAVTRPPHGGLAAPAAPSAHVPGGSSQRQMKNIVHNYSEAEIKVREATSNDPWGPSSSLMSEIADLTYNVVAFSEIMSMIWKRLNHRGKNWRRVYKAMTLMECLSSAGRSSARRTCTPCRRSRTSSTWTATARTRA